MVSPLNAIEISGLPVFALPVRYQSIHFLHGTVAFFTCDYCNVIFRRAMNSIAHLDKRQRRQSDLAAKIKVIIELTEYKKQETISKT